MNKILLMLVLFAAPLLSLGAHGEDGAEHVGHVLVATEKSAFKNALVEELAASFASSDYEVTLVEDSRKELGDYYAGDFDAVVVINAGVNSQVRPWVSSWLAEVEDTERVVLVTTYRDLGWEPIYPEGVDSITTPSKKSDVSELVNQIANKVEEIL